MYTFWHFSRTEQPKHIYSGDQFDAGFEELVDRFGLDWYSPAYDQLRRGEQVALVGGRTGTLVAVRLG